MRHYLFLEITTFQLTNDLVNFFKYWNQKHVIILRNWASNNKNLSNKLGENNFVSNKTSSIREFSKFYLQKAQWHVIDLIYFSTGKDAPIQ